MEWKMWEKDDVSFVRRVPNIKKESRINTSNEKNKETKYLSKLLSFLALSFSIYICKMSTVNKKGTHYSQNEFWLLHYCQFYAFWM